MAHCWSAADPGMCEVKHDGAVQETFDAHLRIHWKMK